MHRHLRTSSATCRRLIAVLMAALLAIGLPGCASAPEPIDQRRAAGAEGVVAAAEWEMRQFQQQPRGNPGYEKLVRPQPVEDPLNAGRDLERPAGSPGR
jgi:hypothetical protein